MADTASMHNRTWLFARSDEIMVTTVLPFIIYPMARVTGTQLSRRLSEPRYYNLSAVWSLKRSWKLFVDSTCATWHHMTSADLIAWRPRTTSTYFASKRFKPNSRRGRSKASSSLFGHVLTTLVACLTFFCCWPFFACRISQGLEAKWIFADIDSWIMWLGRCYFPSSGSTVWVTLSTNMLWQ